MNYGKLELKQMVLDAVPEGTFVDAVRAREVAG